MSDELKELCKAIRHGLFADRGTNMEEAAEYMRNAIRAGCPEPSNLMLVTTGVQVFLNTLVNRLEELNK